MNPYVASIQLGCLGFLNEWLVNDFIERILNNSFGPCGLELGNQFPNYMLVDDCLDGDPSWQTKV